MDCESFFQNKFNSMLVTTSWIDELKDRLGIEAVSQIWGDGPAWYLWLSGAEGVYRLQLAEAVLEKDHPLGKQGLFSITCYPFLNTGVFNTFSYEERALSQSDLFDDTHTPRFEKKNTIPDSLFNVAALEYRMNQDDSMACFTLDSLDVLRSIFPEGTVLDFDLIRKSRRYQKGEIDRAVPGWQLAYPVFDRLLCMYAFYSRARPVRLRITRSPGFEYVHTGHQSYDCIDAPDTHRLVVSVYFKSLEHPDTGIRFNEADIMEPDEEPGETEVLLDTKFPSGELHFSDGMVSAKKVENAPVNPLWWSLANTTYSSNLASTCGCH